MGARQMSAQLQNRGYHVGRRKAHRYMNEMDIYPIYPKMNLSKRMQQGKGMSLSSAKCCHRRSKSGVVY
ncbi:MAG: IS3 family transposase [Enterocloster clostridioformis]